MLHPYPNVYDAVQLAKTAAEVPLTSKCGRQRYRKDQKGSKQIDNAEVFDKYKANYLILDIIAADIENHATIGDNSNEQNDKDQGTLQSLGKKENFSMAFFCFLLVEFILHYFRRLDTD